MIKSLANSWYEAKHRKHERQHPLPRHASLPTPSTKCNSPSEESEDSYYIPNDHYLDELGYDFDILRRIGKMTSKISRIWRIDFGFADHI
jgi:hypothetical protein